MNKNRIQPKSKYDNSMSSQVQASTQQNFVSIHELSSINDPQKHPHTIHSIRKKYIMQNLINRLKFLIAPSLKSEYVTENWTQQPKVISREDLQGTGSLRDMIISQLSYNQQFWKILKLLQAICIVVLFWASSTELFFNFRFLLDDSIFTLPFKIPFCLIIILKNLLKQFIILHAKIKSKTSSDEQTEQQQKTSRQTSKYEQICQNLGEIAKSIMDVAMCCLYLMIHSYKRQPFASIMLSIIVIHFSHKTWNSRQNLEIVYNYVEDKDLKKQFRIIVVFFLVMGVCHIFALILYALTYAYPHENWMKGGSIAASSEFTWFAHYTCSFYFAISTMATVGYGDFTPVQVNQMVVVIFIQLFGTAVFGYMINVMGLTVAEINTKNEVFENHISTIHKLEKHYQISRQLCQKFKQQIIKNQSIKKETPLSQKEEIEFFKMIQNTLKQQFILETNIRVIKKSIFFLTHFTVNFQNEIALKLVRKIYKKNERIPLLQIQGDISERRMLIINSGSVDIQLQHQYNNIEMRKFIKNISPIEGKPTLNVFGYSALILNIDIDLVATTKDTTVIYLLKRRDVLECMDKNMLDFEGIGELREKMLQYSNINYIEAPSMLDIEKHYVPNVFFVQKKKKRVSQNKRSEYNRSNRKTKIRLITIQNFQYRTMMCIDIEDEILKIEPNSMNKMQSTQQLGQNNEHKIGVENQHMSNEELLMTQMDQVKIYENFMKKSNINKLLHKYQEHIKGVRKHKKMLSNFKDLMTKMPVRSATRIQSLRETKRRIQIQSQQ